jgi:hypothetical protein
VRPETQLFLHVLGATVLFGSFATAGLLALAGRREGAPPVLAGAAFRTLLALALPAWVLMFVFGNWTKSKEDVSSSAGWLKVGSAIGVAGIVVLLLSIGAAYAWSRTPARRALATATGGLAVLYLVALGVAWWVMTAKVPT